MNLSNRSEKAQPTTQVAVKAVQPSSCSKTPREQTRVGLCGIPCYTQGKFCPRGLSHSAVPLSLLRLAGLAQSINQLTNPGLHLKGWDLMGEKAASPVNSPF